ncbi:MAG: hypothetical protein LCH56_17355 [Proteobacteria bacterium]|nr:hypothetical protein [Pseudomonadota bacterium]
MTKNYPCHPEHTPSQHKRATARLQRKFNDLAAAIVSKAGPYSDCLNTPEFRNVMILGASLLINDDDLVEDGICESREVLQQHRDHGNLPASDKCLNGNPTFPAIAAAWVAIMTPIVRKMRESPEFRRLEGQLRAERPEGVH